MGGGAADGVETAGELGLEVEPEDGTELLETRGKCEQRRSGFSWKESGSWRWNLFPVKMP